MRQDIIIERDGLTLCASRDDTLTGADALIICTDWRQFKSPDFELLRKELAEPVIFDGRNIYDPARIRREGFTYYGIGLGDSVATSDPPISELVTLVFGDD